MSLFSRNKGQVVLLALLHSFFGDDWPFALERGFEIFDEGITQRSFAEAQAQLLAWRQRNALLPEYKSSKEQFRCFPSSRMTPTPTILQLIKVYQILIWMAPTDLFTTKKLLVALSPRTRRAAPICLQAGKNWCC